MTTNEQEPQTVSRDVSTETGSTSELPRQSASVGSVSSADGSVAEVSPESAETSSAVSGSANALAESARLQASTESGKDDQLSSGAGSKTSGLSREARTRRLVDNRLSSELRNAKNEAATEGVTLSPAELRNIADIAESEEEQQELRQEAEGEKLRQQAMRKAKQAVNPSVPAEMLIKRPTFGQVIGAVQFHMRDSYSFLLGRNRGSKHFIAGLFEAAASVNQVVRGYHAGCPYAAWYLVQIEELMDQFRTTLKVVRQEAENLIAQTTSIRMEPYTSKGPSDVHLVFKVKYGFLFTDLLKQYDEILRMVRAYMDAGFINRDEYKAIEGRMGKPLRRLFYLPGRWRFVGRDAVLQQTAPFLIAEQQMGILPEGYLDGSLKPKLIELRRED